MKIDEIGIWEAFYGVAVYGNFSRAAKELRLGVPQLSKRVAKLEDHLGVRLFQRSTRVVSLTDEGKSLLPKVSAVLEDLKGLESAFENQNRLSGLIRITSVPFVADRILIPAITKFRESFPEVRFELELSEGVVNLIESNIDMALRIHNQPEDSSLVYRKLFSNRLILCASAHYLKNTEAPIKKPEDIRLHNLLFLNVHRNCRFKALDLRVGQLAKEKNIVCENGWFLTQLARSHAGVLLRSYLDVQEDIKKGTLVEVLKKYPLEEFGSIYTVVPSRRLLAPRIRSFSDFLAKECSRIAG